MQKKYPPNNIRLYRTQDKLSQGELATRIGVTTATIEKLENSKMALTHDYTLKISNALQRHPSDILKAAPKALLIGTIGHGWSAYPLDNKSNVAEQNNNLHSWIDAPDRAPSGMLCVNVEGSAMEPYAFEGDTVFFKEKTQNFHEFIHKPALVWTTDNRFSLKIIRPSAQYGYFDLDSYNGDLISNVQLEYVAKVLYVERG